MGVDVLLQLGLRGVLDEDLFRSSAERSKKTLPVKTAQFLPKRRKEAQPVCILHIGCASCLLKFLSKEEIKNVRTKAPLLMAAHLPTQTRISVLQGFMIGRCAALFAAWE